MFGIDTEDSDLSLVSDRESSNSPPHPSPIRARDGPQSETGAQAAVGAGSASTISGVGVGAGPGRTIISTTINTSANGSTTTTTTTTTTAHGSLPDNAGSDGGHRSHTGRRGREGDGTAAQPSAVDLFEDEASIIDLLDEGDHSTPSTPRYMASTPFGRGCIAPLLGLLYGVSPLRCARGRSIAPSGQCPYKSACPISALWFALSQIRGFKNWPQCLGCMGRTGRRIIISVRTPPNNVGAHAWHGRSPFRGTPTCATNALATAPPSASKLPLHFLCTAGTRPGLAGASHYHLRTDLLLSGRYVAGCGCASCGNHGNHLDGGCDGCVPTPC